MFENAVIHNLAYTISMFIKYQPFSYYYLISVIQACNLDRDILIMYDYTIK